MPTTLTNTPLLTVGTYIPRSEAPGTDYVIVFDKNGGGSIFPTSSFDTSINATTPFYYDLGSPQPVQMAGISLTQKAFAVNLADTAYVFDQVCSLYAPSLSWFLYAFDSSLIFISNRRIPFHLSPTRLPMAPWCCTLSTQVSPLLCKKLL